MRIRIEAASPVPPFEQVRAQISLLVAAGQLRPGDRLPTIRGLAHTLDVASGTIARAYRELEYTGIVIKRGRAGTFVADEPPVAFEVVDRRERLEAAAERFVLEAGHLGVDATAALAAVTEAFRSLDQRAADQDEPRGPTSEK